MKTQLIHDEIATSRELRAREQFAKANGFHPARAWYVVRVPMPGYLYSWATTDGRVGSAKHVLQDGGTWEWDPVFGRPPRGAVFLYFYPRSDDGREDVPPDCEIVP